ncbi:MAG: hypothetical protein RQ763_10050, partial [Sulfurimonas sp.]|nr:hypothetical protein [Sulfurimonas sp.]
MMVDKIKQDRKLLEKQLFWVEISFNECTSIGIKSEYTVEEFGKFETLCSRYQNHCHPEQNHRHPESLLPVILSKAKDLP